MFRQGGTSSGKNEISSPNSLFLLPPDCRVANFSSLGAFESHKRKLDKTKLHGWWMSMHWINSSVGHCLDMIFHAFSHTLTLTKIRDGEVHLLTVKTRIDHP